MPTATSGAFHHQSVMDISFALDTLRTATDEALQSRSTEIARTLSILCQRLQLGFLSTTPATVDTSTPPPSDFGRDSPSTTNDHPITYENDVDSPLPSPNERTKTLPRHRSDMPSVTVQPTTIPKKGPRQKIKKVTEKLVRAIPDHILWLCETIHTGHEIISKRDPTQDLRMEDYRRVEGDNKPSNQNKLLRLLSIRSLAKEFAQETRGKDRLQTITEFVLSIQSGELGPEDSNSSQFKGRCRQVSEFVDLHPTLSSASDANRAINKGMKHLVFEGVLKKRLEDLKLPNSCEAVSAILGLSMDDFKSLNFAQMPQLVDALLSDDFRICLRMEELHVLDVLRSIDPWFTRLQTRYNDFRMMESALEFEWPGAKRVCYDNQTAGLHNSPYSSTYHEGSSNLRTLPINIENSAVSEAENQSHFDFAVAPLRTSALRTSECPRSEVNPLPDNLPPDELESSFDYTFHGTPYGAQRISTDIETQPVDYTIPYDALFAELAPCLSAHMFDFTLPPIST